MIADNCLEWGGGLYGGSLGKTARQESVVGNSDTTLMYTPFGNWKLRGKTKHELDRWMNVSQNANLLPWNSEQVVTSSHTTVSALKLKLIPLLVKKYTWYSLFPHLLTCKGDKQLGRPGTSGDSESQDNAV